MKKFAILLIFTIFMGSTTEAIAKPACVHRNYNRYYVPHYHDDNRNEVTKSDYITSESNFENCKDHVLQTDTIVNFYSDGLTRTYTMYTIKNADGTVLQENCYNVKHIIYNKKHYFIFSKKGVYKIMNSKGEIITSKKYSYLEELTGNRILAKFDKKYGVIDLDENIIVPIKYKSFEKAGKDIYITKLNGYYGIMNSRNEILIENEYDKIKPFQEVFILKKEDKYGLANKFGSIIYDTKYEKIKDLNEYLLIKDNSKYGVINSKGEEISQIKYNAIRMKRNRLEGKLKNGKWVKIQEEV